jgi:hypothetical protein
MAIDNKMRIVLDEPLNSPIVKKLDEIKAKTGLKTNSSLLRHIILSVHVKDVVGDGNWAAKSIE